MPVTSIEKRARLVERHVMSKIAPLQKSLLENRGEASRARAALARLRRLTSSGDVAWTLVGSDIFEGWPEELECPHEAAVDVAQDRALMAVCGVLGLYALHQQSESQPMAIMQDPEQGPLPDHKRVSFGRACRQIAPNLDDADGIRRRLVALESLCRQGVRCDMDGVLYNMRGLVTLMKSAKPRPVRLDYGLLAHDLYLLQFHGACDAIMMRWGRDYFSYQPAGEGAIDG